MPNRIREWRQRRGLSQEKLADLAGTTKAQISKLEAGERRLTTDWMRRLAGAMKTSSADLLLDDNQVGRASFINSEARTPGARTSPLGDRAMLPVRGYARGGAEAYFAPDQGSVYEMVECPTVLTGVENAYAVYMVGDSMWPKYEPGQVLYVHPWKPIRTNDYVIVQLTQDRYIVKRYVKGKADGIVLHQFQPEEDLEIPKDEVLAVHKVVTADEV